MSSANGDDGVKEPEFKKLRMENIYRYAMVAFAGVRAVRYSLNLLLAWCQALDSIATELFVIDKETVGINFNMLPDEFVDPKAFPVFYEQLEGETDIDEDNVLKLLPWNHFMQVKRGLRTCDDVLFVLINDGWEGVLEDEILDKSASLDKHLEHFVLASKYGSNRSLGAVIDLVEDFYQNKNYFQNAVYFFTAEHWKTVIAAAAWDDNLAKALLQVMNAINEEANLDADDLNNRLLPYMIQASVEALLSS